MWLLVAVPTGCETAVGYRSLELPLARPERQVDYQQPDTPCLPVQGPVLALHQRRKLPWSCPYQQL